MMAVVERLEQIVRSRIESDRLDLPAPPEAATACLAMLKDSDAAGKDLVRILEKDPLLAAQVMRVAGSARFGAVPCTTLEGAVTRLGHKNLKAVVLEAQTRKLFTSRDPRIGATVRSIFVHALATATLGRDIAGVVGTADQETVYLAGLLHDVGKVVMASYLLEAEKGMSERRAQWIDAPTWLSAVKKSHREVGVALAKKWAFPEPVIAAVRECAEYDAANRAAPANFVCFANALVKQQGIYEGDVDLQDAAAIVMVGRTILGVDDEVVSRLTKDLQNRVTTQLA